jgi:hypothetical protein
VFLSRLCRAVAHVFGDRDFAKLMWFFSCQVILVLCPCVIFIHLDELFGFCFPNHFFCSVVVNTLIKGEKIEQIKLTCTLIL